MSNLVSSGDLAAGSAVIAGVGFKGATLFDLTGDATLVVWAGGDAAGTEIARLAASDEVQSPSFMLPGDTVIPLSAGLYYTVTGTGAVAIIYTEI